MELEILKNFVNNAVEVLVGGVWLEGYMTPIVKSVVTLLPLDSAKEFYGPAAVKAENIMAIRQMKIQVQLPPPLPEEPNKIKSSFEQVSPGIRFGGRK